MSIWRHQIGGYGIADLSRDRCDIRLNPTSYLFNQHNFTSKKLVEYLHSNDEAIEKEIAAIEQHEYSIADLIFYHDNLLCVTPPNSVNILCTSLPENSTPASPFYFHSSGFDGYNYRMNRCTGKRLPSCIYTLFLRQYTEYINPHRSSAEKLIMESELIELADQLGFSNIEDAVELATPWVPDVVVKICEYLCLFNDKTMLRSFRPMFCTFWS